MKPKPDKHYRAWLAERGCLVCGDRATIHHCRKFGSPRNDARAVPLCPRHHQIQFGKESIEYLGRAKFAERFGVDVEDAATRYREEYERYARR